MTTSGDRIEAREGKKRRVARGEEGRETERERERSRGTEREVEDDANGTGNRFDANRGDGVEGVASAGSFNVRGIRTTDLRALDGRGASIEPCPRGSGSHHDIITATAVTRAVPLSGTGGVARRARATRDLRGSRIPPGRGRARRPTRTHSRTFPPRLSPRTRESARRRPAPRLSTRDVARPRRHLVAVKLKHHLEHDGTHRESIRQPRETLLRREDVLRVRRDEQAEERHATPSDRRARVRVHLAIASRAGENPPASIVPETQQSDGESVFGAQVHSASRG